MQFYNLHLLGSLLESFLVLRTARGGFLSGVAKRLENSFVVSGRGGGEGGTWMSVCLPWGVLRTQTLEGQLTK